MNIPLKAVLKEFIKCERSPAQSSQRASRSASAPCVPLLLARRAVLVGNMSSDLTPANDTVKQHTPVQAQSATPPGVTPDRLAAVLQASGYRATVTETNGYFEVKSAAQGLNFFARFGNKAGPEKQFLDFTFYCPLAVNGELSQSVLDLWNRSRRFARLTREQQLLVLSMDVLAAGGVPDLYLRAHCELWDGMIRDLIVHLRSSGSTPPPAAGLAESSSGVKATASGIERH